MGVSVSAVSATPSQMLPGARGVTCPQLWPSPGRPPWAALLISGRPFACLGSLVRENRGPRWSRREAPVWTQSPRKP